MTNWLGFRKDLESFIDIRSLYRSFHH